MEEANILEAAHSEMWMNRATLLTLQSRHEGHGVAHASEHSSESIQVTKDSVAVGHALPKAQVREGS